METLQITDGTTTFDFAGVDAHLLYGEWAPRLPMSRPSILGGGDPYGEVEETITFQIIGTSGADALSTLGTLVGLMEQAARFGRGEAVTAVSLKYRKTGSNLANVVQAVILGGPANGREYLELPGDFDFSKGYTISPITLYLRRRATWLDVTGAEAKAASTSSGNPAVMTTAAFTNNTKVLSPYAITLVSSDSSITTLLKGFLAVTNSSDNILFLEAEAANQENGTYQDTAVITGSSNGSVLKYLGGMTGGIANRLFMLSTDGAGTSTPRNWAVFTCVHNLSTTHTWYIRPLFTSGLVRSILYPVVGRTYSIDPTTFAEPQVISLGVLPKREWQSSQYGLEAWIDSTGANGTDDLYVDWVCFVGLSDSTRILYISDMFEGGYDTLHIGHFLNSNLIPLVYRSIDTTPGLTIGLKCSYSGDAMLAASGNSLSAIVMGNTGAGTYTMYDASEINFTFTATRMQGYLAPP